ncbi:hypothetical protein E4U41_001999 [Claviceps citrina]|nr:hypothetical protein E4U41_001999 [Claviceps citrina]
MNWTRGARSRVRKHSTKDDAARQKEHFAKSRMRRDAANGNPENSSRSATSRWPSKCESSSSSRHFDTSAPAAAAPVMSGGNGRQTPGVPTRQSVAKSPSQDPATPPQRRVSSSETTGDTASMTAKKRRLLDQLDWTGVALQKPLLISYPKPSKKLQESRACHNLRTMPASLASQPDNIRVQVGSQDFR